MRSVNVRWVPIEIWPGKERTNAERVASPFSGNWNSTLELLDKELFHLGARDTVIQAWYSPSNLRLDGMPRVGSVPRKPGVIVTFKAKGIDLSFPCDRFLKWTDNLRAIALALEALRKVERYGVTRQQEQYKGWAKLPPAPEKMKPQDAIVFMGLHAGQPVTVQNFKSAYRTAAARLHPDNQQTGNEHLFRLLGDAKRTLEESYGWGNGQ